MYKKSAIHNSHGRIPLLYMTLDVLLYNSPNPTTGYMCLCIAGGWIKPASECFKSMDKNLKKLEKLLILYNENTQKLPVKTAPYFLLLIKVLTFTLFCISIESSSLTSPELTIFLSLPTPSSSGQ